MSVKNELKSMSIMTEKGRKATLTRHLPLQNASLFFLFGSPEISAMAYGHVKRRVVFFAKSAKNLHPAVKNDGLLTCPYFAVSRLRRRRGAEKNIQPRRRTRHCNRKTADAASARHRFLGASPEPRPLIRKLNGG